MCAAGFSTALVLVFFATIAFVEVFFPLVLADVFLIETDFVVIFVVDLVLGLTLV